MNTTQPMKTPSRSDRCCTCGRPRGLAPKRSSWGLECPTVIVPRTSNPDDHPWQITNDLSINAAVWRNGGSDDGTYLCDDCIRIGLREIKLKVDELLGVIEADADKDAELATLTARLGDLQFEHQSAVFEHNRMQKRLADLLKKPTDAEAIRMAKYEVNRWPLKNHWGNEVGERAQIADYLWPNQTGLPNEHRDILVAIQTRERLAREQIQDLAKQLGRLEEYCEQRVNALGQQIRDNEELRGQLEVAESARDNALAELAAGGGGAEPAGDGNGEAESRANGHNDKVSCGKPPEAPDA